MEISQLSKKIPYEIIDNIFSYDGRIKFKRNNFVNVIHPYDERYDLLIPIINKKLFIIRELEIAYVYQENGDFITNITTNSQITNIDKSKFYLEIWFDNLAGTGLCFDYFWSYNYFEICYFDMRNNGWKQIRTIIN